jgi:mono/diheme cytochrome c family protein/glucose/arabinose dehydrogenase
MHLIRFLLPVPILLLLFSCSENQIIDGSAPSPPKSPQESLKTFQIEKGLEVQLVAAEPLVQDPIFITFDEDGRLWVVEMRSFMPDIDGEGESLPLGRINILEDTNGDGKMDKSTIYLDSLIMPRALGLIKGGALVAENNALWITYDDDGDLRADRKELFDPRYAANGIPEHSDNGLLRNIDNWYYNAKSHLRYRQIGGEWVKDSTEARGQYGISHDDFGRLIYNYNWSQLHGDLVPPNYLSRNPHHSPSSGIDHGLTIDRRIYPIRPNHAVNRGYIPGTLDEHGRLLEFTAACSPVVFRSPLFSDSYYGNVFVCEPAGNLVKRNVFREAGIVLEAFDPNPGKEFLASTDERFRPVHSAVGPDGSLYIADMYRGLIQHGSYVTPYLREQTLKKDLVLPIHMGRIWRVVPKKWSSQPFPKLSQESSEDLIQRLNHEIGWHRDMAQRLLIERNDLSIVPLLQLMVKDGNNVLGRLHALYTLEGLDALTEELLLWLIADPSTLLANHALRLLEPVANENPDLLSQIENILLAEASQATRQRALQLALSAYILPEQSSLEISKVLFERFGEEPTLRDALMSSLKDREFGLFQSLWNSEGWEKPNTEREIFLEILIASLLKKGDSQEIASMVSFVEQEMDLESWKANLALSSMAIHAADSKNLGLIQYDSKPEILDFAEDLLSPNKVESLLRMFRYPGHSPESITLSAVALNETEMKQFASGRQKYLTSCAGCHGSDGKGVNRMGPPLAGSEWVTEDETRLALIILHGMEGPLEVSGKIYDAPDILPIMPSHSTMDDASIAAILTYIRNEWGNQAPAISGRLVGTTRHTTQGRVYPWSAEELNKHIQSKEPLSSK